MPPLVSVLVPVYNGEKFIESTLEAVLAQPLQDIEVIVTDNASTDATPSILKSIAARDERVHAVRNPRNLGPLRNNRVGLELSSGSFIKWQAADDYLDPVFLAEGVGILESRQDVVTVIGAMPPVSEDRTLLEFDESAGGFVTDYGEIVPHHRVPDGSASEHPSERFESVVSNVTGNLIAEYFYGLHRGSALRSAMPIGVYLGAEKVLFAELLLRGKGVASNAPSSERVFHPHHFGAKNFKDTITGLDPEFKGRFALPAAKQAVGYARAIRSAPLSSAERSRCFGVLAKKIAQPQTLARLFAPGPQNYFGWGR